MEEEKERWATESDEVCRCGHKFDGHIVVAYDNPLDGGLIFCQRLNSCDCAGTWSVQGLATVTNMTKPPPHVIEEYRQQLLSQLDEGAGRL